MFQEKKGFFHSLQCQQEEKVGNEICFFPRRLKIMKIKI